MGHETMSKSIKLRERYTEAKPNLLRLMNNMCNSFNWPSQTHGETVEGWLITKKQKQKN